MQTHMYAVQTAYKGGENKAIAKKNVTQERGRTVAVGNNSGEGKGGWDQVLQQRVAQVGARTVYL